MDQASLDYGMGMLDELEEILRPIGMSMEKLNPEQTQGIPTGVIRLGDDRTGWEIACNVVPTHREDVSTTFVQLYLQLTPPCPDGRSELQEYARGLNEQFLMGTVLVFQDCLCMKYVLALEPAAAIEETHIQAAVFAFCQQADRVARQGQAIIQKVTMPQTAAERKDD